MMRMFLISAAMFLVSTGAAMADTSIEKCLFCHDPSNEQALTGKGADNIATKMKAIRAGDVRHPPGLADLSDEDIAAMAAALAAGI